MRHGLLAAAYFAQSFCPFGDALPKAQFSHCVDGDTFGVNVADVPDVFGLGMPVRLRGVNAAELRSPDACEVAHAQRARARLCQMAMAAKHIDLRCIGRDKYFRLLAAPYFDGVDVAARLLYEGYAVPYDGKTKPVVDWCARALPPQVG